MIIPTFPQLVSWSKIHSVVPFICEIPFPKIGDGYPLYLAHSAKLKSTFFLDGFNAKPLGRYSYFPLAEPRLKVIARDREEFAREWKGLRAEILRRQGPQLPRNLPAFWGGAVGMLSYDCGRVFERGWKSRPPEDPLRFPWMEIGFYDDLYCLDHQNRKAFLISCLHIQTKDRARLKEIYQSKKSDLLKQARALLQGQALSLGNAPSPADLLTDESPRVEGAPLKSNDNDLKQWYLRSVRKLQSYIAAGDIYQANLSQRISVPYGGSGLQYFGRLRSINPSPYAFYGDFEFGELASCSPELLIKKRGGVLETRPIAGTRPRGSDKASDLRLQGELLLSDKERAEHVMLLDLERNDLGRVCVSGSVKVKEKMIVEKYSHVMHIVSCVRGKMKKKYDAFKAIEAVFPGGTITGCPKVRCVNILDELEPVRRGPFYGSFGWIGYDGNCEMNLLIRTALLPKNTGTLVIQAGSGIVADSDASREFEESRHKAQALLAAAIGSGKLK